MGRRSLAVLGGLMMTAGALVVVAPASLGVAPAPTTLRLGRGSASSEAVPASEAASVAGGSVLGGSALRRALGFPSRPVPVRSLTAPAPTPGTVVAPAAPPVPGAPIPGRTGHALI